MNNNERLILLNQYEILSRLEPDNEKHQHCIEILSNGYEVLYSEVTDVLSEPLSASMGEFVIDVLQMYRSITFSYDRLEDKGGITLRNVAFKGFDGNEEGKLYTFARFYLEDFNRFAELLENEHMDFNSHSNKVNKYSRMLEVWNELAERYDAKLTVEQIQQILNA